MRFIKHSWLPRKYILITLGMSTMMLFLFAGSAGAIPIEEWNRTYPDIATISDIAQTRDGRYIIAAPKHLPDGGLIGYYLIKTDASGIMRWNKRFESDVTICCIEKTADGGYLFAGSKSSTGDYRVKSVAFVVKTDSNGIEQWNRIFDENIDKFFPIYGGANSIQQTQDGGYILAENTVRSNTNNARIIKLDSSGNIEWMRTFENSSQPSVLQTTDGSYVISVSRLYNQEPDIRLIMLDARGNDLWNRTYQGMTTVQTVHFELTADGGFLIASEIKTPTAGIDGLLIKTDAKGNELWNKTFGGTGDDGFSLIHKTRDGGYILAGYTSADHSADLLSFYMGDAWLFKIDADGNKQWDMIFGELEMKYINSFRQTGDGGYILAGRSGIKPQGSWAVKLTNDSAQSDNPSAGKENKIWTKTTQPLVAVTTENHTVTPPEKAAGFEAVLAIAILLAACAAIWKRR